MKQSRIIRAYHALKDLSSASLPIQAACKLYRLKKQLQPVWDFQAEEEMKLLEQYKPQGGANGVLAFETAEARKAFEDRMTEMADLDVDDLSFTPVTLPVLDVHLSMNDIEALEGLVEFTEG